MTGPYNMPHPECGPDEVWWCNVAGGDADLARIAFRTKRMGQRAYRYDGTQAPAEYRPVFVAQADLEACGVNVSEVFGAREAAAALIIKRRLATPQTRKGRAMKARAQRLAGKRA